MNRLTAFVSAIACYRVAGNSKPYFAREAAADRSTPDTPDDKLRIAVETINGALPKLNRDLVLGIHDPEVSKAELEERTPRVDGLPVARSRQRSSGNVPSCYRGTSEQ
jgi:hypothetical protein